MENEKKLTVGDVNMEISHWMDGRLRTLTLKDLTNRITDRLCEGDTAHLTLTDRYFIEVCCLHDYIIKCSVYGIVPRTK